MSYVFDTSSLRNIGHIPRKVFQQFWKNLDAHATSEEIVSVYEVFKELELQNVKQDMRDWAERHRSIFHKPTTAELEFIAEMFRTRHWRQLVARQQILRGRPAADPFVIAAGKVHDHCVVTEEGFKPNAGKVPNVCAEFGVDCITFEKFCQREGWQY